MSELKVYAPTLLSIYSMPALAKIKRTVKVSLACVLRCF